jgi:hypothetical protein
VQFAIGSKNDVAAFGLKKTLGSCGEKLQLNGVIDIGICSIKKFRQKYQLEFPDIGPIEVLVPLSYKLPTT